MQVKMTMSRTVTIASGKGANAKNVYVNGADGTLKAMLVANSFSPTPNGNLLAPEGMTLADVGNKVDSFTRALAAEAAANPANTPAPKPAEEKEFAFEVNTKDGKSYVHGIKPESKWHKALIAAGATTTKTGDLKIPDGKDATAFLEATLGKDKIAQYGSFKVNDLNALAPVAQNPTPAPKPAEEKEFAFEVNVKDNKSYVHGIKPESKWHKALIAAGATTTKTGDLKIPDGKDATAFLEATLGKDKIAQYGSFKVNDLNAPANDVSSSINDYASRASEMAKTPEGVKELADMAQSIAQMAQQFSAAAQKLTL